LCTLDPVNVLGPSELPTTTTLNKVPSYAPITGFSHPIFSGAFEGALARHPFSRAVRL